MSSIWTNPEAVRAVFESQPSRALAAVEKALVFIQDAVPATKAVERFEKYLLPVQISQQDEEVLASVKSALEAAGMTEDEVNKRLQWLRRKALEEAEKAASGAD